MAGESRDLFGNAHGAGKGSKERNYGWREEYDAIDFHRETPDPEFIRNGSKIVKRYGATPKN